MAGNDRATRRGGRTKTSNSWSVCRSTGLNKRTYHYRCAYLRLPLWFSPPPPPTAPPTAFLPLPAPLSWFRLADARCQSDKVRPVFQPSQRETRANKTGTTPLLSDAPMSARKMRAGTSSTGGNEMK